LPFLGCRSFIGIIILHFFILFVKYNHLLVVNKRIDYKNSQLYFKYFFNVNIFYSFYINCDYYLKNKLSSENIAADVELLFACIAKS